VLYATSEQKLAVLKRDAVSGELVIERVYALDRNDARGLGLVDLERASRERIELSDAASDDTLAHPELGLDPAQAAARRLVETGGADRAARRLDSTDPIARRTAAIALGEHGYLAAIPVLIQVLEGTADKELARRIVVQLGELTGTPLDPDDARTGAARKASDWWTQNAPKAPLARRGHK
jgi:hypothetical protein